MKRTTKTTTSIAALIGAALVIATPTPSSATSPTRWDVCPAIVDEPLCDLVEQAHTTTNGSGTKPAVVPEVNRTPDAGLDMSCGGTLIAHVQVCVA